MFELWKKVIDDNTSRHYCGALTGVVPTSKPYGRDKRPQELPAMFQNIMNDDSVKRKLQYELVFDYESKDPNSEELIYLEFIEHYNKDCNMVFLKIKRFDGSDLSISMNEVGLDLHLGGGKKMSQLDVEMAVDLAKWVIAKDMGNGRMAANDVICRKNFTPFGVI
jgi:hypothetical protein